MNREFSTPRFDEKAAATPWRALQYAEGDDRLTTYARWFIALRWIAVAGAGVLTVFAVKILEVLPDTVFIPLLATVAVLAAFNLVVSFLVTRRIWIKRLLPLQVYGDLTILTILLSFSGYLGNPFSELYILHVILAGVLLSPRQCYAVAIVAAVLLSLVTWGEWAGVLHPLGFQLGPLAFGPVSGTDWDSLEVVRETTVEIGELFIVAYLVTTLARRARSYENQLEDAVYQARAEHRLLEQALETTGAGLRVLDMQLKPRWVNRLWEQWFHEKGPVVSDDGCPGPTSVVDNGGHTAPSQSTRDDKMVRITECALPADAIASESTNLMFQREHIARLTTAPLVDDDGAMRGVVQLAQDVTQQKEAEAQMLRAGRLSAVGELAGHVAHEVNNPITIIGAKSRLLLSDHRGEMSDKCADEIAKFIRLSDRVAAIAGGLLSYSRPSTGVCGPVDVSISIRRSLAMLSERAKKMEVRIVDNIDERVPLVEANADEMEQVFLNLFLNSLDALPNGGSLTVSISTAGERLSNGQRCLAIIVEDSGVGIPDEVRSRIFEPFFTTKGEQRGTGLGLAICLGIVTSHGGEIDIESEPGRGTAFRVKLRLVLGADEGGSVDG